MTGILAHGRDHGAHYPESVMPGRGGERRNVSCIYLYKKVIFCGDSRNSGMGMKAVPADREAPEIFGAFDCTLERG